MTDKPRLLFVDDNKNLLDAVNRILRKKVELVTAISGKEALRILETQPEFAVLVSDQNMPNMKGDALLAEAAKRWPMTVRVMLTGNDDQVTAAAAVNEGKVFRFIRKPCDANMLLEIAESAVEHHRTITAERDLLEQTLAGSIKVLSDVIAAIRPDLYQNTTKVRKGAKRVASHISLANSWELDLAAMLYPLGLVAVPDAITNKYKLGEELLPEEQDMIDQSAQMAAKLIYNIPRLKNVADGISMCRKGFDGSGFPVGGDKGRDIPVISRILRILIDIVDAADSVEMTLEETGEYLRQRAAFYDPDLLDIVIHVIENSATLKKPKVSAGQRIKLAQLQLGDVILEDVLNQDGKLILSAGSELTELGRQRLGNVEKSLSQDDIVVLREAVRA